MIPFIGLTTLRFDGKAKVIVFIRIDQIAQVRTHAVRDRADAYLEDGGADLTFVDGSVLTIFETPHEVMALLERADGV